MPTRQRGAEPAHLKSTNFHQLILEGEDTLYPLEITADGKTKHSRHCKALFARRDFQCRRCLELLRGSAPRGSWQDEYASRKLGLRQRTLW